MHYIQKLTLAICLLTLGGCASYKDPKTPPLKLANINSASLDKDFKDEQVYRGTNAPKRRIGLAMSGGGTKAGMFAHGVLHGLQRSRVLEKVDVISTASGSNYPVFWYFTKQMEAAEGGFNIEHIFDDCVPEWYGDPNHNDPEATAMVNQLVAWAEYRETKDHDPNYLVCENIDQHQTDKKGEDRFRWQAHLARWPDVFETHITQITGDKQKLPWRNTFWLSGRLFAETALTLLPFDSGIPVAYMQGIERTWGLNPKPRDPNKLKDKKLPEKDKWEYTNSKPTTFGAYHVDPERVSWEKLQALYSQNPQLPLWIMNTTEGQKRGKVDMYNLYELTPFSYGSARHGYHQGTPPMPSISYGVRASAAFFDTQGATGVQQVLLGTVSTLIPATTWGVKIEQPSPPSIRSNVRLSDGGGADNLGLMSLLRRGLDQIIVVDTAQDVEGRMDDLCWAKAALDHEGFVLELPALDKLNQVCLKGQIDSETLAYNVSEWKTPVITGVIKPKQDQDVKDLKEVKVFWIKAAWNEYAVKDVVDKIEYRTRLSSNPSKPEYFGICGKLGQISCWLPVYYMHNRTKSNGANCHAKRGPLDEEFKDCFFSFPQLKTVDTTFSSSTYQFWAYRELAASFAQMISITDKGDLQTSATQCSQHAEIAKRGRRPTNWDPLKNKKYTNTCDVPTQTVQR